MTGMSGEYATSGGGVGVTATGAALREWGGALLSAEPGLFHLTAVPASLPRGWETLRLIEVHRDRDPDTPVTLAIVDGKLLVSGGKAALTRLADDVCQLAALPYRMTAESVPSHIDLEYYEGHPYLGRSTRWLTVTKAAESRGKEGDH
jgi:hypothetical protein